MQSKKEKSQQLPDKYKENINEKTDVCSIKESILNNLFYNLARLPHSATVNDWYLALSYTIRDMMIKRWVNSVQEFTEDIKVVVFLSDEFLLGPQLEMNIINLDVYSEVSQAVQELGLDLKKITMSESEPGLGYGRAGSFAASSLDSITTLGIPAIGYGIRYEFGQFEQDFQDGWQIEKTDKWLISGNPWEILRSEISYIVKIGGGTESYYDEHNNFKVKWMPKFAVKGIAYDIPVTGYKTHKINLLRLWKTEAIESFDYDAFNSGDYLSRLNEKIASESIGKILYPDDEPYLGKHLRLSQQYFFVSCALQDLIRLHLLRWKNIHSFSDSFAIQLNSANPAIAVAELMRILIDEHGVDWDRAWYITQNSFSYTNYAVVQEALKKWPLPVFASILPRHLEIIYEINKRFLDEIWLRYPNNNEKLSRLSIIDESDQKYVRMAHLASIGSHIINGISEEHTKLLKETLIPDICEIYPERFRNITGGVTHRRWLLLSNPELAELISRTIGDKWVKNFGDIKQLAAFSGDPGLIKKWQDVRVKNKIKLSNFIKRYNGDSIDDSAIFSVQAGKIHEQKRQHLNLLHIITVFNRLKKNPSLNIYPRVFIFSGKASPGYFIANLIIKLINSVAEIVNKDPDVAGRIKVVFLPDFNVKKAQIIFPATDIAEHISTSGKESFSSSHIKCLMNGALAIGTLNGGIDEICREIGHDNYFKFGLTPEQIIEKKSSGYNPVEYYNSHSELKEAIDLISSGFFYRKDPALFKPLIDSLLCRDEHMVLADYESYTECQTSAEKIYRDKKAWTKRSILTVAGMGYFSSDRMISEYNNLIWFASTNP